MPMAEASSISFVAPMLATLLGIFLLKEKVEPARWVAVAAGFIGVLIIIRPGSGIFSWVAALPLATAASFATYQILTRKLAGVDNPYTSLFYSGLIGTVMLAAVLPFQWTTPTTVVHALMLPAIGFIGGLSHLILIRAYDQAAVSTLAPFSYTQLIWVILMGYLVFGDFPDHWSLIGIAVIMASGIYIPRINSCRNGSGAPNCRKVRPAADAHHDCGRAQSLVQTGLSRAYGSENPDRLRLCPRRCACAASIPMH